MKVRFSEQAVRCRVTRMELDRLLSGRSVALIVPLPHNHVFRLSVRPAVVAHGWQLESDPTGLWLTIPRHDLESLAQSLPSKEGLEQCFDVPAGGTLRVSFEVDVKDRARRTPDEAGQSSLAIAR